MLLYAITCQDKPNSVDLRMETRPAHVEHLQSLGDKLKGAGPLMADDKPVGSLVIIQAADQAEAEAFAENDPYNKAGLFDSVTVRPWNWVLANPYITE